MAESQLFSKVSPFSFLRFGLSHIGKMFLKHLSSGLVADICNLTLAILSLSDTQNRNSDSCMSYDIGKEDLYLHSVMILCVVQGFDGSKHFTAYASG